MAIRRLVAAGVQPITWLGLAGELQRDWARTESLGEVAQLFIDHAGATGSVLLWETQLVGAPEVKGALSFPAGEANLVCQEALLALDFGVSEEDTAASSH